MATEVSAQRASWLSNDWAKVSLNALNHGPPTCPKDCVSVLGHAFIALEIHNSALAFTFAFVEPQGQMEMRVRTSNLSINEQRHAYLKNLLDP